MPPPGNYRLRTNLFVCTVCRFADGTPGRRALRAAYRSCSVGRDHWARRCRNYRLRTGLLVCTICRFAAGTPGGLRSRSRGTSVTDAAYPLRVRALRDVYRNRSVGRDDPARRCRNYGLHTNLFVCTVRRFAVGGHMCPPYRSANLS